MLQHFLTPTFILWPFVFGMALVYQGRQRPTSCTAGEMAESRSVLIKEAPQEPPDFSATAASLVDAAKGLVQEGLRLQKQLVDNVPPATANFANSILLLAQNENARTAESHILEFYQHVAADRELQAASRKAQSLLLDFALETYMRRDVFDIVDSVLRRNEELDLQSRRFLEEEHKKYVRHGIGLPDGPQLKRFRDIQKCLNRVKIEFSKNLNDEHGGIWFTEEELDGVPNDLISLLEKGTAENEGKFRLTFQYTDFSQALAYATRERTRKKVYVAYCNRCNDNVPLLREAVVLRDEAARILGYPNHAALRLQEKMIKSPNTINAFLGDLQSRLSAKGTEEVKRLQSLKIADVGDDHYYLWDQSYYTRRFLEEGFGVDQEKIAEYFPLMQTIHNMLEIFSEMFGLIFIQQTENRNQRGRFVWHTDVRLFEAWDEETDEFLGHLYMDLHPREGKFGHTANLNLRPVSDSS
jgi:metallopeptidase MepB